MRVAFLLFLWLFSLSATAAGFDCAKAQSPVEKLICDDQGLSTNDSFLDGLYQLVKAQKNQQEAQTIIVSQRKWLKDARNLCTDKNCLNEAYVNRQSELFELVDRVISCETMRQYPQLVFTRGLLNNLRAFRLQNDCPENIVNFEYIKPLNEIAGIVRSEYGGQCQGTIVIDHALDYSFTLALASFLPETFAQNSNKNGSSATMDYFRQWATLSPYNDRLYQRFLQAYQTALPLLTAHYQNKLMLTPTQAANVAELVLKRIAKFAAGSAPFNSIKTPSALLKLVDNDKTQPSEILAALQTTAPEFKADIYQALAAALAHNRELVLWLPLLERLNKDELQSTHFPQEPLLSFAIAQHDNLKVLLQKGVPVEAENAFGKTALFYAIEASDQEAVKLLLDNKADVDHAYKSVEKLRPNNDACIFPNLKHTLRTPLMHAAQHSNPAMLKLLLVNGAKLGAKDELQFNALDYALMAGNQENIAFLKSQGLLASEAGKG